MVCSPGAIRTVGAPIFSVCVEHSYWKKLNLSNIDLYVGELFVQHLLVYHNAYPTTVLCCLKHCESDQTFYVPTIITKIWPPKILERPT